jgi:hypothetical protein
MTSQGLSHAVGIVLANTEAWWLRGIGCIPLHSIMEDAATAEISRARIGSGEEASECRRRMNVEGEADFQCVGAGKSKGKWRADVEHGRAGRR